MARFRNFENMLRIFAFHEKVNWIYFRENIFLFDGSIQKHSFCPFSSFFKICVWLSSFYKLKVRFECNKIQSGMLETFSVKTVQFSTEVQLNHIHFGPRLRRTSTSPPSWTFEALVLTLFVVVGWLNFRPCPYAWWLTNGEQTSGMSVGCKPFQEKFLEIGILCISDSVFSPDSEYCYQKS